jgi:hypothetical protein
MLPGESLIVMLVGVCHLAIESCKAVQNLQKIAGPLGTGSKNDESQVSGPLRLIFAHECTADEV